MPVASELAGAEHRWPRVRHGARELLRCLGRSVTLIVAIQSYGRSAEEDDLGLLVEKLGELEGSHGDCNASTVFGG